MRKLRLPDLLIEVDNGLEFTRRFLPPSRQPDPAPDEIRVILAAVMAHGCNIGPHTMAQLTADVTYEQLKSVGDWQLTRDTQREALGVLVKAIASGKYSIGLRRAFRCSGHNWLSRIGSSSHSLCCEPVSEERSAGNPHATFCRSRRRVTASGHPANR